MKHEILFSPPNSITIPTPIMGIIREYQRGIHNRSNSGCHASIRLSTEEDRIIDEACEVLGITDYSTFFRWCAMQSAIEIVNARQKWEEQHDAT